MKLRYLALPIVLLVAGCNHTPPVVVPVPTPTPTPEATPTPTPTPLVEPTPEPPPSTFSELRLTTDGGQFVRLSDPTYETRKCVACCADTIGTGWPGLNEAEIDLLYYQGLCNLVHWRVGPFTSQNEPEWPNGGAYIEDPASHLADLSQFNQPYWDALRAGCVAAGVRGMNCEVSVLDAWGVKTQCWRSNATAGQKCAWHPWHKAGNIQHQDHLTSAWQGTSPDPIQYAYLVKVFETVGDLENVIFEGGTEPDQLVPSAGVPGRKAVDIVKWDLTQAAILRNVEVANGWRKHLYGTNFPGDVTSGWLRVGRFDYLNTHKTNPVVGFFDPKDFLRPLVNDEYNPTPAMQPIEMLAFYCYSKANGSYWAAWRHDQKQNPWLASLSLIAGTTIDGCSDKMKTGCAFNVLPTARVDCGRQSGNAYDCTPKNGRGQAILQEGSISRSLCEESASGLKANQGVEWSSSNPAIKIIPNANRWKFQIQGPVGAKGNLHCKIPVTGLTDACHNVPLEVK
jgi:hypothetical protein